jgi:hypothetical protein
MVKLEIVAKPRLNDETFPANFFHFRVILLAVLVLQKPQSAKKKMKAIMVTENYVSLGASWLELKVSCHHSH